MMAVVMRRLIVGADPSSVQPVADAPHRGERQVVAELLAELAHVDVDGALVADPAVAPHAVEQLPAAEGEALVFEQVGEQVELAGREGDRRAVEPRLAAADVDLDAARPCGTAGWLARLPSDRRRSAFTRATSSRGENGLVT